MVYHKILNIVPCAIQYMSAQSFSCVQLFVDYSPPGSYVHEISLTRMLEWIAISSSRGSSWPRD